MSPIEYIAEGIRQGNWKTICEGYERLTGNSLPLPKITTTDNTTKALRQIADIASSVLNGSIAEICNSAAKPMKKKPGRPKGSGKKKVNKKATVNKDGKDSSILLDDSNKTAVQKNMGTTQLITNDPDPAEVEANKIKAQKANRNKLKLDRKATTIYEVECNECNNSFQSTRPKGEMGQKCPKCLSGLKDRFT